MITPIPTRPSTAQITAARHGFTLVELLVVIAIIGILVALLMPAVQGARESGRRSQCSNQLRQIGLALRNYAATHEVFPPGAVVTDFRSTYDVWGEATGGGQGTSWIVQVLPQLEQQNLFDRWDFQKNVLGNADVARTEIAVLYCPSRRRGVEPGRFVMFQDWTGGGTDYGACLGFGNAFWDDASPSGGGSEDFVEPCHHYFSSVTQIEQHHHLVEFRVRSLGMFTPYRVCRLAEIRDGTSNTIMVGEMQRVRGDRCQQVSHDGWAVGGVSTLFDVQFGEINNLHFEHPGSDHTGGAFFCLADGSVHFISEHTDSTTLKLLSCMDDLKVVRGF